MKKFTLLVLALLSFCACQNNKKSDNQVQTPQNIHDFISFVALQPQNSSVWVKERNEVNNHGDSIFVTYNVGLEADDGSVADTIVSFWEPVNVDYEIENYTVEANNAQEAIDNLNQEHLVKVVRSNDVCIYLHEPNLKRVYGVPNGIFLSYQDKETAGQQLDFISFGLGSIELACSDYAVSLDNMHLIITQNGKQILSKNVQSFGEKEI